MPSKVTSKLASSSLHRLFSKRCYVVTHYHADACYMLQHARVNDTKKPDRPSCSFFHIDIKLDRKKHFHSCSLEAHLQTFQIRRTLLYALQAK